MNAYDAYLANFKAQNEPEFAWNRPSLDGATEVAYGVWELADGRVAKRVFNGSRESYRVWASSDAYHGYVQPLSENQFYHG
jgi:hypothetical protein